MDSLTFLLEKNDDLDKTQIDTKITVHDSIRVILTTIDNMEYKVDSAKVVPLFSLPQQTKDVLKTLSNNRCYIPKNTSSMLDRTTSSIVKEWSSSDRASPEIEPSDEVTISIKNLVTYDEGITSRQDQYIVSLWKSDIFFYNTS